MADESTKYLYGFMIVVIVFLLIHAYRESRTGYNYNSKDNYTSSMTAAPNMTAGSSQRRGLPTTSAHSDFANPEALVQSTTDASGFSEAKLEGFANISYDASTNINAADYLPEFNSNTEIPVIDYDPSMIGLEQVVRDSHAEFVQDAYVNVQTPTTANSVRDDDTGAVKAWGLRRVDYTGVYSGADARVVSSEYPEQLARAASSIQI